MTMPDRGMRGRVLCVMLSVTVAEVTINAYISGI